MTVAEANSSYGKSVTSKMSAINLEELASNNAEQFIKEFTMIINDLKPLTKMENAILQYHCKKL